MEKIIIFHRNFLKTFLDLKAFIGRMPQRSGQLWPALISRIYKTPANRMPAWPPQHMRLKLSNRRTKGPARHMWLKLSNRRTKWPAQHMWLKLSNRRTKWPARHMRLKLSNRRTKWPAQHMWRNVLKDSMTGPAYVAEGLCFLVVALRVEALLHLSIQPPPIT